MLGTGGEGLGRGGIRDNSGWNTREGPWVSAFEQAPWEVGSVDEIPSPSPPNCSLVQLKSHETTNEPRPLNFRPWAFT